MKKLKDLPDEYEAPIISKRFKGMKKVLLETDQGIGFGWEDPKGDLYLGAITEPSGDFLNFRKEEHNRVEVSKADREQFRTTVEDLKKRRKSGEPLTQEDLVTLADLFLGTL